MLETIEKTISRYNMLSPGDRVGVAASGGADSTALLHALVALSPRLGIHLEVLHLNHGLRGEESDGDEAFVRAIASNLGLPVHVQHVDLRETGGNLEEIGRYARRTFFASMRETHNLRRVATGHTRSDQAETVLFRFLRGAGPQGLCGILPVTSEGLIRPLLAVGRSEVEAWLRAAGLPWRDDSSNRDPRYSRNRLRHGLLPELQRDWNPNLDEVLSRLAEIVRSEEEWWAGQIPPIVQPDGRARVIPAAALASLHPALARRMVRLTLEDLGLPAGFEAIEAVRALAAQDEGSGRIRLTGLDVLRSFDWIRISDPGEDSPERFWEIPVTVSGRFETPAGEFEISNIEAFAGLVLRNWRPGDRIQPPGAAEPRLLKQYFQDARVPLWQRRDWPLLEFGGRVVWARWFLPVPAVNTLKIVDLDRPAGPL